MIKYLKEVQEENRKAINSRYGLGELCWACEADGKNWSDADGWVDCAVCNNGITLSQVLIATQDIFFSSIMSEKESTLHIEYNVGIDDPLWVEWDLTKLTLGDQSEETQREINNLLTNPNNKESDE
jgi:hypothetical protein